MLKPKNSERWHQEVFGWMAISSPCFELWLILHFRDSPGGMHRHKIQKLMEKHIANYNKRVDYADFKKGYPDAIRRATKLAEQAQRVGDPLYNPSTAVDRLTELIRDAGIAAAPGHSMP